MKALSSLLLVLLLFAAAVALTHLTGCSPQAEAIPARFVVTTWQATDTRGWTCRGTLITDTQTGHRYLGFDGGLTLLLEP